MRRLGCAILRFSDCRQPAFLLALSCLSGAIFGYVCAVYCGASLLLLTRMAVFSPVSVVGLSACCLLPFLYAALAAYLSCHWLLYLLCFVKLFLFCFCGCVVYAAFGTAGWLVRSLFQFSDSCLLPVLCWFCLRCLGSVKTRKRDFAFCLLTGAAVGILDFCVISPLLASFTNN